MRRLRVSFNQKHVFLIETMWLKETKSKHNIEIGFVVFNRGKQPLSGFSLLKSPKSFDPFGKSQKYNFRLQFENIRPIKNYRKTVLCSTFKAKKSR